jgi:hypothetical protein
MMTARNQTARPSPRGRAVWFRAVIIRIATVWSRRAPLTRKAGLALGAALAALSLTATFAIAPQSPPDAAAQLESYISTHPQSVRVSDAVAASESSRDDYSSSAGVQSLVSRGTNYDWARLVLLFGGWPRTEANVTVMVRWMRQENGTNSWWNRNNPMNNGYGSGGGGGFGSYDTLEIAAQAAADNLRLNASYKTIVGAFAVSAPTSITEHAIWASPWASSHYGNGASWHTTPVPEVTAPTSAW